MSFLKKLKNNKKNEILTKDLELELKEKNKTHSQWFQKEGELVVDVFQTDSEIILQSPIAGIDAKKLDISIENDILTIKGNRDKPEDLENKKYIYKECWWGPFSRRIILPEEVNPEEIKATMKKGILNIKLSIIHREKERKISVK